MSSGRARRGLSKRRNEETASPRKGEEGGAARARRERAFYITTCAFKYSEEGGRGKSARRIESALPWNLSGRSRGKLRDAQPLPPRSNTGGTGGMHFVRATTSRATRLPSPLPFGFFLRRGRGASLPPSLSVRLCLSVLTDVLFILAGEYRGQTRVSVGGEAAVAAVPLSLPARIRLKETGGRDSQRRKTSPETMPRRRATVSRDSRD